MALFASGLKAQTIAIETFEDGLNEYAWGIGTDTPSVESSGGNPGAYLREGPFDLWAPQIRHGVVGSPAPWLGDYVARGVTEAAVDLTTMAPVPVGDRRLTFVLRFGLGTSDGGDDVVAYVEGDAVPKFGDGWVTHSFVVPRSSDPLPPGWEWVIPPSFAPVSWDVLLQDVASLSFFYGSPVVPWPVETWTIGVDNLRLGDVSETFRRGDCNGDGGFDLSDAIFSLTLFFSSGVTALCESACDANDDGNLDIADSIRMLGSLFVADPPLPEPLDCGVDPTPDALDCGVACP